MQAPAKLATKRFIKTISPETPAKHHRKDNLEKQSVLLGYPQSVVSHDYSLAVQIQKPQFESAHRY
jgi:hypothetical protein